MAIVPAAAPNALIQALRAGTPGLPAGSASTYSFLPNIAPTYAPRAPRAPRAPALMPVAPSPAPVAPPALAPAPIAPPAVSPAPPPVSSPPPPVFVPPVRQPSRIDVVPDDVFVGPMPDDFVGPMPDDFVGPMPDDFVGPMPQDDVAQTFPVTVTQPSAIQATDLPTLDAFEPVELPRFFNPERTQPALKPSVTVIEDLDVTDTPVPVTDPADDFEIDRELGLVQQSDVFVGPSPLRPAEVETTVSPNVTVNEVDVTDTVAPPTDPADDFELDRELGLVQQSDVFVGPQPQRQISNVGNVTQVNDALTEFGNIDLPVMDLMGPFPQEQTASVDDSVFTPTNTIANVGNVTDVSINPDDFSMYADMLNTDITSTLPAAVPAPATPEQLTDQDLFEMALFELLSQQLLTRGAPGMTDEETVER